MRPLKTLAVSLVNALLVASALVWNVQSALAQTAALIPNAKQQFFNANGDPLAGGSVFSYVPNTTTPKTTWIDPFEATPNANPVVLDAGGGAFIFGQGNYRQVVKDAQGNLIWDGFTSAYGSSAPSGSTGIDTAPVGTILPWAGSNINVPTNWQLAYGQALSRTTFAQLEAAITISTTTGNATSTSTTISGFADTSEVPVGAPIECSCLPTGTTVASVTNATTLVVSQAATATGSFNITVFPWGDGDGVTTFNVPDLRGRVLPGADAMGGTAADRLTSTYYGGTGASTMGLAGGQQYRSTSTTLTQANLPNVNFNVSGITLNNPDINIGNNQGACLDTTSHCSGGGFVALPFTTVASVINDTTITSNVSVNSQGTAASGGSDTPAASASFATIQPSITMNYIIKVAPNTTGAGGVVSIGGMFGDILCGTGILCTNQTLSLASTSGTVTSVGLSLPATFTVTGSPVTAAGTLTATYANEGANMMFAGPSSGSASTPSFRVLVSADVPPINLSSVGVNGGVTGILPLANGGTNANLAPNAGGIIYSTASALGVLNNPNSNGECLLSGTSAPTWGSCSGAAPAVATVGNAASDTTLTIAGTGAGPWTGNVTAALNLANMNTWTNTVGITLNGTTTSGMTFNTPATSEYFPLNWQDNGTNKWQLGKDPSNDFYLKDRSNGQIVMLTAPNGGNMNLMPSAGGVSVGTTTNLSVPNEGLAVAGDAYFASGRPWVDVRAGGNGCSAAAGNNSTDDTAAIQCQITFMRTTYAGGIVFFPCGNYKITSTIVVSGPVILQGAGVGCSLINVGTGLDVEAIQFVNTSAQQHWGGLRNLQVNCLESSSATKFCVEVDNFVNLTFEDFQIWGGNWALFICGSTNCNGGSAPGGGTDNTFRNGFVSGWGSGGGNIQEYNSGNWFYDIKADTTGQTTGTSVLITTDSSSLSSIQESDFFRVDMSGSFSSQSFQLNDAGTGRSTVVMFHPIFGATTAMSLGTFKVLSIVGGELGSGSYAISSGQLIVTGSMQGNGSGSGITFTGGSRSCAGNAGVTC